jgi:D-inositol-3-phosphate glycosyltransferase
VAAAELKISWQVPVVHMFHTLVLMKNRVAQSPNEMEGDYRLEGERKVLGIADRVIAATPAELAQLQFLYRADTRKIVIIPPGVDTCRFYPIPPDEAREFIGVPPCGRTILFVGRIEPLKGLDILFQAITLLRKRDDLHDEAFCLTVIGGEPEASPETMSVEMARLQSLRAQFDLGDLVTFLGKRDQETLPYYYSAAEIVVVPSFYESFGMVALEAMACGTPVVGSQVGGLAFLIQDGITGYTVPVEDPQALADRLGLLLKDEQIRLQMGALAAEVAKKYAWQNIAEQLVRVYRELSQPD